MAAVAAVRWVLERAGGAGVGGPVLDSELQQLGLPKEHAAALTRVYSEHQPRLRQALRQASLKGESGDSSGRRGGGTSGIRVRVGKRVARILFFSLFPFSFLDSFHFRSFSFLDNFHSHFPSNNNLRICCSLIPIAITLHIINICIQFFFPDPHLPQRAAIPSGRAT